MGKFTHDKRGVIRQDNARETLRAHMLDQSLVDTEDSTRETVYDLVVIGAGIAGLNALNAACEYLPKGARVLLLDEKDTAGGMWNIAYDYVRLHQPHPMFTVGNQKWHWQKPRHYLAARDEVRDHLVGALHSLSEHVALTTGFGQTVTSCEEVMTEHGPMAEVVYHAVSAKTTTQTVRAKRAIHASGLNYALATPLSLSSQHVVSIIPQDLRKTLTDHPKSPVYVIGGGKTGMDTVLASLASDPTRRVTLINGRGTNFINRTKYVPTGSKRWTSGELVSRIFRDVALQFNGDNEEHTLAHLRATYSTDPQSQNGVFLYGLQSEDEHARVREGLAAIHSDYLTDVADTAAGPELNLRGGTAFPVPDGSIFVNCTGSFFRTQELSDANPLLSPNDCILSINARHAFHFLTSVSGFFTTHLLYRNQLRGRGFYTLDLEALFRKNRNAWIGATAAQAYMNQVIAVQTLPLMLLDRCGLDLDRWYPLPRRMAGLMRMKASATNDIAHCCRTLDRVVQRFGVHGAPVQ